MAAADVSGDQQIDYREFIASTMQRQLYLREENVSKVFERLDVDDSGATSPSRTSSRSRDRRRRPRSSWARATSTIPRRLITKCSRSSCTLDLGHSFDSLTSTLE
jgi:hypothetical protein